MAEKMNAPETADAVAAETDVAAETAEASGGTKRKATRRVRQKADDASATGKYVYIGPSVARTKLREGLILRGTIDSVKTYLADEIEAIPDVEALLIPIAGLAKARAEIKATGTRLSLKYEAVKKAASV